MEGRVRVGLGVRRFKRARGRIGDGRYRAVKVFVDCKDVVFLVE